jgi:S1-C subfamily serine protease
MTASSTESGALINLSNGLADAVERVGRSLVAVDGRQRTPSTGIYWREGVIVAAEHTIEREGDITIILPDGNTTRARVAAADSGTDIAVLRADGLTLPPAEIGDASSLKVGHIVLAVARPGDIGLSATMGAVSALGGPWRTWSGGSIDSFIRPDLTLYPGFSGGPLVDTEGRVVGLNTSGLSRSMPLAIPASTVERVVGQLLSRGRVTRGYLGLGMQPVRLPENLASQLGLSSRNGLIVVSVEGNGPAEKAGLFVGDVIVALGGKGVSEPRDVQGLLDPDSVGKPLTATIVRGGERRDVEITVGERPQRGE